MGQGCAELQNETRNKQTKAKRNKQLQIFNDYADLSLFLACRYGITTDWLTDGWLTLFKRRAFVKTKTTCLNWNFISSKSFYFNSNWPEAKSVCRVWVWSASCCSSSSPKSIFRITVVNNTFQTKIALKILSTTFLKDIHLKQRWQNTHKNTKWKQFF